MSHLNFSSLFNFFNVMDRRLAWILFSVTSPGELFFDMNLKTKNKKDLGADLHQDDSIFSQRTDLNIWHPLNNLLLLQGPPPYVLGNGDHNKYESHL